MELRTVTPDAATYGMIIRSLLNKGEYVKAWKHRKMIAKDLS
jgi:hypothetical protein